MSSFVQDLRYAARTLARTPAFALIVIATLVLGIGANTAIFSVVHAVLVEPLPYAEPERLLRIHSTNQQTDSGNINPLDALDWREQNRSFEHFSLLHNSEMTVAGDGEPVRIQASRVAADFFTMLGVRPARGRFFIAEEETIGKHEVAVLAHSFWLTFFGGRDDALGKTITIGDGRYEIVGVLPPGFRTPVQGHGHGAPSEPAVYRPMALDPEQTGRGGHYMQVIARLKPGVTLAQAQQDLNGLAEEIARRFPDQKTGRGLRAVPLTETIVGDTRKSLVLLMAAVGFVLLIACTNVASLFLARATQRHREIAIRAALGAGRRRILRQMMTEALLVAAVGGIAAVVVGGWMISGLRRLGAAHVPNIDRAEISVPVLLFTLGVALGSALVFGILPALAASRVRGSSAAQGEGRSGTGSRDERRALRWLVVIEVALSIVLVAAAGLLLRSLWNVTNVKPGFDAERLLAVPIQLPPSRYPEDPQVVGFYEELERRLGRHPQIAAVGATNILPFSGGFSCDGYVIEGEPDLGSVGPCAEVRAVTEGFFEAMGIPLVAGRLFQGQDQPASAPVVVVSQAMAARIGGHVVGKRMRTGRLADDQWATIVGISGDIRHFGLDQEPRPEIYLLNRQAPYFSMAAVIRVRGELAAAMPIVRREIASLDPALPLNRLEPMERLVGRTLGANRLRAVLLGSFAAIALLLAATGIYGVLSHGVARRRREIGVRMALGADRRAVLGTIVGETLRVTLVGIAIGVLGALGTSSALESLLYDTSAADPTILAIAAALLLAVAVAAAVAPARRATKVDPMEALRTE